MNWNRTLLWGITLRQLALILSFYSVAALLYNLALCISERPWSQDSLWVDFWQGLPRIGLDYLCKLAFTLPVWYVLFVRLRHVPLVRRVGLHLLFLPLYIVGWQVVYYTISDGLGLGRLRGTGIVWDTYISTLFYLVQFGIFHAYSYYRDHQRHRIREAELRELAVQSELSALKAQLNPHFLYNVFNTISASVPPEQEHTRELLADLSDMFRYQVRASRTEWVPVQDELTFVRKYLDLETARFGDRLQVRLDVPDEVLNLAIPPMLLQPIVENSVKHGISPLIEGGEVRVSLHREANALLVEIADTGAGMRTSVGAGQGVGLANTRLRLEKMFGGELTVMANEPQGTRVAFRVPLRLMAGEVQKTDGQPATQFVVNP
ncbi:sensor histidine kinase [Rudanella paleaurantiibacter]|uniref:histidine kinase n=1 Tax=Rudanella paleaurantiibacter TaxID=2614655 RepID=A0A7J5TXH1_9BACT|nr:histidine kinase [Rudanella paleaurantiibacter]KAB7729344.1 sensor histidine kinase [Rudanella paleaurantiibacter]